MKHFTFLMFIILTGLQTVLYAQGDDTVNVKTGWTLGGIPVISYSSDVGFKYGGLVNFYYFGNGSTYPDYLHSIYLEWSRTTKGSGKNEILLDSKNLIPGIRTTINLNYLTEQALDFYGFNGYESYYNPALTDEDSPDYITRVYYNHERKQLTLTADFQGKIDGDKIRWLGGYGVYLNEINPVDVATLNSRSKTEKEKLPQGVNTLLEEYVAADIIPETQTGRVNINIFKLGTVFDTRDNEANPQRGLWSELVFVSVPFGEFKYLVSSITHRQYFTLVKNRLSLATRLIYQQKITGEIPFFMLPYYYNSKQNGSGFGGSKTIRGVSRNRIIGDGVAAGNLELRWIPLRTVILKQNFYIGFSTFVDAGMVTAKYKFPNPNNINLAEGRKEGVHIGYGGGIRFALNDNFIIAIDRGLVANLQDGDGGLYIGLNWLF